MRRRDLEVLLSRAERSIALLERCRPLNYPAEREGLLAQLRRGNPRAPRFRYSGSSGAAQLSNGLATLADAARRGGAWGALYSERAWELHLEAALVAVVGTPRARALARARFGMTQGPEVEAARRLAHNWAQLAVAEEKAPLYVSDDAEQPQSLVSAMRRAVGERRIGFRIVTSPDLTSSAATGDGVIVVRAGMEMSELCGKRVVMHEVLGHALPRHRAVAEEVGLYRVGSAGGPDEEEGRALLIEDRHELMGARRKRQLGLRHLAALSVHEGATWVDTARLLLTHAAEHAEAVDIASRAHRGGGLGREVVYLESFLRLSTAFAEDPRAERCLERGRVSVRCGRILERLGQAPEVLPTVRAA